ncbi:MAG: hypothetical protein FJW38_25395 [Acidobacteria bacterium]|nr:hypothetical protein [Acidobacteriota bacterium]
MPPRRSAFTQGGPSQMDLFDFKSELKELSVQPLLFKLPSNYEAPGPRKTRLVARISKPSRNRARESAIAGFIDAEIWLTAAGPSPHVEVDAGNQDNELSRSSPADKQ